MNVDQLKIKIINGGCGYTFTYKGELCGMEPIVEKGIFTFDVWHGENNKDI